MQTESPTGQSVEVYSQSSLIAIYVYKEGVLSDIFVTWDGTSLVSRPRPAFRRFQYGIAGEGLVSFLT